MACEVNVSSPLVSPLVSRLLCQPADEPKHWPQRNETVEDAPLQPKSWILLLSGIPILTLLGNLLVCLSVWKEKSLQTVTNYFTVSLAVADIMVALLVMPLAIYVEVRNGVWQLGDALCDTWVAFDVMCCTASILNLTAISIDRFIAVTQPLKYAKHKNSKRVLVTLGLTWLISLAVSSPIALGLNYTDRRRSTPWRCTFYNADFLICSSLTSFYIPCLLMMFLYYKTLRAIVCRAKKKRQRTRDRSTSTSLRLWSYSEVPTKNIISKLLVRYQRSQSALRMYNDSVVEVTTNGTQSTLELEAFQNSNGRSGGGRGKPGKRANDQEIARRIHKEENTGYKLEYDTAEQDTTTSVNKAETEKLLRLSKSRTTFIHDTPTLNRDSGEQTETCEAYSLLQCSSAVDSSKDPHDCSQWSNNRGPIMSTLSAPSAGSNDYLLSKAHSCTSDCRRQVPVSGAKRRTEGRHWFTKQERKATTTLAIVLGVFLFCWVPFFVVNTINAFCIRFDLFNIYSICNIRSSTFSLFVWLGYVNSCLNPFIYTVFNAEFRKAFKKRLQALCK